MKRDRQEYTLIGVLAVVVGLLAWAAVLVAQPGHGPRNIAPNPNIRSVAVEAAPGDSVDVTTTWGAAIVRPGGGVADLHVLDVFDQATVRFLVTDSLPPTAASGGTFASTMRVPADTADIAARACVQAFHQHLESAQRCSDFTIPARLILEDPGAPNVEIEFDSVAVMPDSATIAVGDSVQFTAWVYSGDAVIGCSGNCVQIATLPLEPATFVGGVAHYIRIVNRAEEERARAAGFEDVPNNFLIPYDRRTFEARQPLLAALWRTRLQG